ncbi:MAG: protoporphyrinogen oxidase [Rhodobacteraceae bacterium]|nr:protoporphyrinogen oxidase [Paracoccaceae bacterium]
MKILTAYGTTEGQTGKIARFCADQLTGAGHSVELLNVADAAEVDVSGFGAAILAGSVHAGKYQAELSQFIAANLAALKPLPTLFLSVSLSAAGDDPQDWAGLESGLAAFTQDTGWTPGRTEHVAGALRFTEYDFFRYWAMRWIAAQKDETVDPHKDKEYTDWDKLSAVLHDWSGGLKT